MCFWALEETSVLARIQLAKFEEFVQFVEYVYLTWWLTCPIASAAGTIEHPARRPLKRKRASDEQSWLLFNRDMTELQAMMIQLF